MLPIEEGGWKPTVSFLPEVNKAQAKHKIDSMIADWVRLQRHWKKINEASRDEICDYFESFLNKDEDDRKSWDNFGEILFNKSQREVSKRFKELSTEVVLHRIVSMEEFNLIKFVNPLSLQRRNSVRMMNLRVKEFKEG